jgi:ABC-type antimicrobial peptide transport system permease subunit
VLGLVLRRALGLAAAGLVLGIGGALAFGRLLAGMLYGVAPGDPATLGAVAVFVLLLALAAALLPGRRAARVEPSTALRQP